MPPALLLTGDKQFYGSIKPIGLISESNAQNLQKPAPPPNPTSKIALTTDLARRTATTKLTNEINNPNSNVDDRTIKADNVLDVKDTSVKKIQKEDDITTRIINFIDNPLGLDKSKEDYEGRTWTGGVKPEVPRITTASEGIADAGTIVDKNIIQPIRDVGSEIGNKFFQFLLIIGAIYLGGEYLKRPRSSKKDD